MSSGGEHTYGKLSEAVQPKPAKPALGPPHDTWAAVLLTAAIGAVLLFQGRLDVVDDWISWVGWLTAMATAVAGMYYFQRAYGFASRGWGHAPMGAVMAAIIGFLVTSSFVAPAVYEHAADSAIGLVYIFTGLAMLPVGILRATLGPAGSRPAE